MPRIELATVIAAPIERVFDLARSIDLHSDSMAHTGERAVGGVTSGLIGLGEMVTWRARHFGVWQGLTSRITLYERPTLFGDAMVSGAFRRFDHEHRFETQPDGSTLMRDVFDYTSPLGVLGHVADVLFLAHYMRSLLERRNAMLKETAESPDRWRRYLPAP